MTQTYEQLIDRLNDPTFQKRCEYSVLYLVRWIKEESDQTPLHSQRLAWANSAWANSAAMAWVVSKGVITDGNCTGDTMPTQDQVRAAVEAMINNNRWVLT